MSTIGLEFHNEDIHNIIHKPMSPTIKSPRYKSKRNFLLRVEQMEKAKYNGHQTFGLPHYEAPKSSNFLKKGRPRIQPAASRIIVPKCSFENPKRTTKNFVRENIKKIAAIEPKVPVPRRVDTPRGTVKDLGHLLQMIKIRESEEYGQIPEYLCKRRRQWAKEKKRKEEEQQAIRDYKAKMGISTMGMNENVYMVEPEVRQKLLDGLKENWKELSKQFLKLPVMSDTLPKIKRKMWLEREIDQLERDVQFVERHPYIYLERRDTRPYAEIVADDLRAKSDREKADKRREREKAGGNGEQVNQQVEQQQQDEKKEDQEVEMEKLNSATEKINSLELELDEANTAFRVLLNDSIKRLKLLSKKLGSCIERARPYYEAVEEARKAQTECQRAAVQYQRANEVHQAAKETVAITEERFLSRQNEQRQFDSAWQDMLNQATVKVMEAETKKTESGLEHQRRAAIFNEAEQRVQACESKLRRSISRSRPYFEEKELCQRRLASQKDKVERLQKQVMAVKTSYTASLKKLERISEEIHMKRGTLGGRGVREPGVGAENDAIAEMDLENYNFRYRSPESQTMNVKYAKIISSGPGGGGGPGSDLLLEKNNALNKYYPAGARVPGLPGSTGHPTYDYEVELDRCDLGSLGSASATTSSVVSDEDCVEDDSELEELKQMAERLRGTQVETICDGSMCNGNYGESRTGGTRVDGWERQLAETVGKLGAILSLKSAEPEPEPCPSLANEKY